MINKFLFLALFSTHLIIKRPQYIHFTSQIEKTITLFTLKWQKFLPFADGKNFAISNGKHFSYDRKNLFRGGISAHG